MISASILYNSGLLGPLDRQVLLYNENNRNGASDLKKIVLNKIYKRRCNLICSISTFFISIHNENLTRKIISFFFTTEIIIVRDI